jgi:drug/metabolite transporter (DMT)-like permease
VRLPIAAAAGVLFALLAGRARRWLRELSAPGIPARMVFASAIGTCLGIWFSLIAIGALPVAIASTQTSTTPIFGTVLVALLLGERVSARAWLWTVVAVAGVAVLFLAKEFA